MLLNFPKTSSRLLLHVLQGLSPSGPVLTLAEVLIAIHSIDPDKDGIPLKKLPQAQLEGAVNKIPALKAPLAAHAAQQKSTLPRSVLVVLGIICNSQAGSQSQSGQPEAGDVVSSEKDVVTEKSKESSGGS